METPLLVGSLFWSPLLGVALLGSLSHAQPLLPQIPPLGQGGFWDEVQVGL